MKTQEAIARAKPLIALEIESKLIENAPKGATGRLMSNIRVTPSEKGFIITMPRYGIYTEYGLPPGIFPNIESLKVWCKAKLGDENLVWAVAKSIEKNGTKPQYWIRDTMFRHLKEIIVNRVKEQI